MIFIRENLCHKEGHIMGKRFRISEAEKALCKEMNSHTIEQKLQDLLKCVIRFRKHKHHEILGFSQLELAFTSHSEVFVLETFAHHCFIAHAVTLIPLWCPSESFTLWYNF